MRTDDPPMTIPLPSHSKGAQRKRRLRRGVERWGHDLELSPEPCRRIARVTLTVADEDPAMVAGHVRRFWAQVRRKWLGTRYFCWLELQRNGRVHYHAVWVNPPHARQVDLLRWVDHAWGRGRTQVRFSDGSAGLRQELEYALSYTKKMGRKSYQQRYDQVPTELRTFMTQRLEIPGPVLDEHQDRDDWVYVRPSPKLWGDHEPRLRWAYHHEHLVPSSGYCTAIDHRRARYRKKVRTRTSGGTSRIY